MIPMDVAQGDLDKRLTLLPGQKQALEQALKEQSIPRPKDVV